jgi:hypothetical protein
MSQKPYQREQGDLELRILKDGRLVLIAPDETLLEIAQTIEASGAGDEASEAEGSEIVECGTVTRQDLKQQHLESHDAETAAPGRE